jgi:hypothetical protein
VGDALKGRREIVVPPEIAVRAELAKSELDAALRVRQEDDTPLTRAALKAAVKEAEAMWLLLSEWDVER